MSVIRIKTRQKESAARPDKEGKFALTVPADYYRYLEYLGELSVKQNCYHRYRSWADKLVVALQNRAPACCKVIRLHERTVILEKTDNPFGNYWTQDVLYQLSERFGLGKLWDRARNDP